jgi:hypothetical protein
VCPFSSFNLSFLLLWTGYKAQEKQEEKEPQKLLTKPEFNCTTKILLQAL